MLQTGQGGSHLCVTLKLSDYYVIIIYTLITYCSDWILILMLIAVQLDWEQESFLFLPRFDTNDHISFQINCTLSKSFSYTQSKLAVKQEVRLCHQMSVVISTIVPCTDCFSEISQKVGSADFFLHQDQQPFIVNWCREGASKNVLLQSSIDVLHLVSIKDIWYVSWRAALFSATESMLVYNNI